MKHYFVQVTFLLCMFFGGMASGKEVPYVLQLNNMTQHDIYLWMLFDGKQRWDRVFLVGGKNGRPGAEGEFDGNRPWPSRVQLRWRLEGVEGWREQEIEVPPYPRTEDGELSQRPYLCLAFFEERALAFNEKGFPAWEFKKRARAAWEVAREKGLPGARISTEYTYW